MRLRPTARLLVIDERQRILLIQIKDTAPLHPAWPTMTDYWITPGGGVDPGESFAEAARRELYEETGLREPLGPWVWYAERVLNPSDGSAPMLLQERFYLVPTIAPQVSLSGLLPYEQATHRAYRWWALDELVRADEIFLPAGLQANLGALLGGQIPPEPLRL